MTAVRELIGFVPSSNTKPPPQMQVRKEAWHSLGSVDDLFFSGLRFRSTLLATPDRST
jgi:hypothetical protein